MKEVTTSEGKKGIILNLRKKSVEVTATEKSGFKTGSKRMVLEHMVPHLLKKGMIEDPNKKSK